MHFCTPAAKPCNRPQAGRRTTLFDPASAGRVPGGASQQTSAHDRVRCNGITLTGAGRRSLAIGSDHPGQASRTIAHGKSEVRAGWLDHPPGKQPSAPRVATTEYVAKRKPASTVSGTQRDRQLSPRRQSADRPGLTTNDFGKTRIWRGLLSRPAVVLGPAQAIVFAQVCGEVSAPPLCTRHCANADARRSC